MQIADTKSGRRPSSGLSVAGLALCLSLAGCGDGEPRAPGVGDPFPLDALEQSTILGKNRPLLRDKTLLINFWATWCPPCRKEMPELQKLADRLDSDRFAVIAVSVDTDGNLAREFLLEYDIRLPAFQDPERELAGDRLGIVAYPRTFAVAPDGTILARIDEAVTAEHAAFDPWRKRLPAAPSVGVPAAVKEH